MHGLVIFLIYTGLQFLPKCDKINQKVGIYVVDSIEGMIKRFVQQKKVLLWLLFLVWNHIFSQTEMIVVFTLRTILNIDLSSPKTRNQASPRRRKSLARCIE